MNWKKIIAGMLCVDFVLLTGWTLFQHGANPMVWFDQLGGHWLAVCLCVDLILALGVAVYWMVQDARQQQRQVWGYVLLTCLTGSVGVLLYIAMTPKHERNHVQKYGQKHVQSEGVKPTLA